MNSNKNRKPSGSGTVFLIQFVSVAVLAVGQGNTLSNAACLFGSEPLRV